METLQTLPPDEEDDFLPIQRPNGLVPQEEEEEEEEGEGEDVYVDEDDDEDEDGVEEEEEEEGGVERTYASVQERMRCVEMSSVCCMGVSSPSLSSSTSSFSSTSSSSSSASSSSSSSSAAIKAVHVTCRSEQTYRQTL